jgi:menaquinone-dependent protoporphyrinogen oxidase
VGSAVYLGRWRREAARFLKANEKAPAERPVWLFSSGPAGEGDPVALTQDCRFPKALQPIADHIRPRDTAVFHGVLKRKKLKSVEKWITRNVKAPLGDFRDWDAITSWATAIAGVLKEVA